MKVSSTTPADGIVQLVDRLLRRAVLEQASDVHFEPTERHMLVRFRRDGLLHDVEALPAAIAENIVARLKVMAGLLTYRVDIPQEGSLPPGTVAGCDDRTPLDMRVSTFPTVRGERAVVRLLYSGGGLSDLADLGLPDHVTATLTSAVAQPDGMILITGPAGSGKSTTLYAAIRRIVVSTPGRSVVTLEDPVEQRIEGVTQIQIRPHGELDYPTAMRSLLRQDPQVLLVGEIRDAHTASIVVEAALTGHLLLSTMHSGDPAEALVRLLEMGVPAYQVVSTLNVVCSQRLLRRLCPECCRATGRDEEPHVHAGCDQCHGTGYRGRIVCAELLTLNDAIREAVMAGAGSRQIRELASRQGADLAADAARRVRQGLTDFAEVRRMVGRPKMEGA